MLPRRRPVEGRWQYVSMETRMPVGIMPATCSDHDTEKSVSTRWPALWCGRACPVSRREGSDCGS
ncbi:hypothetical protein BH11MYX1_BH11MYX1_11650 [soil metagenome]